MSNKARWAANDLGSMWLLPEVNWLVMVADYLPKDVARNYEGIAQEYLGTFAAHMKLGCVHVRSRAASGMGVRCRLSSRRGQVFKMISALLNNVVNELRPIPNDEPYIKYVTYAAICIHLRSFAIFGYQEPYLHKEMAPPLLLFSFLSLSHPGRVLQ